MTSVSESFSVFLNVWGQLPVPSHSDEPIVSAILPKSPGEAVGHAFFYEIIGDDAAADHVAPKTSVSAQMWLTR